MDPWDLQGECQVMLKFSHNIVCTVESAKYQGKNKRHPRCIYVFVCLYCRPNYACIKLEYIMSQYPLLHFSKWAAQHGQYKVHSSVHKSTHRHTPLPDTVYFTLSKRIGTPENYISVAAVCPSPPLETGEMEQKKRKREWEMAGEGGYSCLLNWCPCHFFTIETDSRNL